MIIPLGRAITEERIKQVREYVASIVPEWSQFAIADCAEYLGIMVGPGGGNDASWRKPINKYKGRTVEIAKAGIAPSHGIDLYNQRAAPTMSYVPQLCLINAQVEKEELLALQRIFHLPHHAFPKDSFYYLVEGGFRKIVPIKVTAQAALIRTAFHTCTVWREELKMLEEVRCDPR